MGAPARRDLRELATFTIDPVTARDFDDAISAERLQDGAGTGVRVWVHIADVSAYVREGSPVDVEARERGTCVYVPGAVEPMLPDALSGDACSLVPGRERAAVTVELELHGAEVRRTAFYRSSIRSDERLDYDRVDRIFAGREPAREPWAQPLQAAREASAALAQARARRGSALTLDSEEPEFEFDAHGEVSEIKARVQTESHRLIEHLMIAANEAVARELERRGVPCLYRVHERPRPASVERLVDQLASLGVATPPVPPQTVPRAGGGAGGGGLAAGGGPRAAHARARAGRRPGRGAHGRPAGADVRWCCARCSRPTTPRATSATRGWARRATATSPPPSAATPTSCATARCSPRWVGPERAPRAETLEELGEWTSAQERAAMEFERDADDVARCFALERELLRRGLAAAVRGGGRGPDRRGSVRRVRAPRGGRAPGEGGYRFEGLLPVRRLAADGGARGGAVAGREWWELNEQGTVLRGGALGARR